MRIKITGIPYAQLKSRGRVDGRKEWANAVKEQTARLEPVKGPCRVQVVFRLPPSKYPGDHPYGMDLDNLLKRFFDALQDTVFRAVPGKDGCVVELKARKIRVGSDAEAGADLEIKEEAVEDVAMSRAIQEGETSQAMDRDQVLKLLRNWSVQVLFKASFGQDLRNVSEATVLPRIRDVIKRVEQVEDCRKFQT